MKTHAQGQKGMSSRFQEEQAYSWEGGLPLCQEGWGCKKAPMPTEQGHQRSRNWLGAARIAAARPPPLPSTFRCWSLSCIQLVATP